MEIITLDVCLSKRGRVKAKLQMDYEDSKTMKLGEYALIKIETLNDRIAVEEFIEERKNK